MKKITWLHLSDIHFHPKKKWRDNYSLDSLIEYLDIEFESHRIQRPDLIFCTGDIAFGESASSPLSEQYEDARDFFNRLLIVCSAHNRQLKTDSLFVIPGNHDTNRNKINSDAQETLIQWAKNSNLHIEKINQRFEERTNEFKSTMSRLDEYELFVRTYLPHQSDPEGRNFYAKTKQINGITVGIVGFNSAWTCSGPEDDRNIWLAGSWQFNTAYETIKKADIKIGLIHHPSDWLNLADRNIATVKIASQYDFWLHGHSHNAWVTPTQSHVNIAAGAVGAETSDEFGFNIVSIDLEKNTGTVHLFTKKTDTDWMIAVIPKHAPHGIWEIDTPNRLKKAGLTSSTPIKTNNIDHAITTKHLDGKLKESLFLFSSHVSEWVQPVIASEAENTDNTPEITKISTSDITGNPRNIIISAPPQYGLTCLAHHLASQAWSQTKDFWLYLDARAIKPNRDSIEKSIQMELESASRSYEDIKCVILDSWSASEKDGAKLLNKIYEHFNEIPVICMQQTTSVMFYKTEEKPLTRESENLHLWSLPRESIRKIVAAYNDKTPIGDESSVTSKIISDMEVLNLHRTPFNCLTLLKVSEIDFDESPVNRTEIIKRVLFILFNIDDVATYKIRPDLKDCEHVLGYFCEQLIREGNYGFSRHRFLNDVQEHSKLQLIDLETQVVFDVLFENNVIVMQGETFYFRFSYWLFYFAAQRMHHNKNFAEYILADMRYAQHPELIEFYTGIDRRREDALTTIARDLRNIRSIVNENCGLPDDLNPYRLGKWNSSEETKKSMQQEVANGVAESNLPEIIKDRYADENYDRRKPYNQAVSGILSDHSFVRLVQATFAGSRALRNSDYACINMKKELLSEIVNCWEQISKIILITLPILSENGSAVYDGVHIVLIGDGITGNSPRERFTNILTMIPSSVARNFSDDLFSMKIGPLLFNEIQRSTISELSRHELILLLIIKRPRGWHKEVGNYIASIQHNSFYLYDIHRNLRGQYRYCFASTKTLGDIEHLIKLAATKHAKGVSKTPSAKLIEKICKLNPKMIPERFQPTE